MDQEEINLMRNAYLANRPRWNTLLSVLERVAMESIPDSDAQDYICLPLVKTKLPHTHKDFRDAEQAIQEYVQKFEY